MNIIVLMITSVLLFACSSNNNREEPVVYKSISGCIDETLANVVATNSLDTIYWQTESEGYSIELMTNWYCDLDEPVVSSELIGKMMTLSLTRTHSDYGPACDCLTKISFYFSDTTNIHQIKLNANIWVVEGDSL
ncbi:MAG: hypothetical protein JXR53_01625 [Bacteroidales bacterium]|nr:hypothetical protein [Bacteroidales bacterium]